MENPMNEAAKAPVRKFTQTRLEVEDFLAEEIAHLDAWDLNGWAELFTEDAVYEVAPTGVPNSFALDPEKTMFLIADDHERLRQRVIRLLKPNAHVEFPKSITQHFYTNVRVLSDDGTEIVATANCLVFRTKNRTTNQYPGTMRYVLRRVGERLLIRSKRVSLALEALIPQGKVSIIL
jgi:p-cumate 2,3-dioxygenase beta subunit